MINNKLITNAAGSLVTKFVEDVNPYNPLNLPANTFRVRTNNGAAPVSGRYDSATRVTGVKNIYDVYKSGTDLDTMFWKSTNIVEVLGANTENVTSMSGLFMYCNSLTSVSLFDTSKVIDMSQMFYECGALPSVPLYNTSNVTSMYEMFYTCSAMTSVPLFDTSKVTNMRYTFDLCTALSSLPLFNTHNVTNMAWTFGSCISLTAIPTFDVANVTACYSTFYNCKNVSKGILDMYNALSARGSAIDEHYDCFWECGAKNQTGSAELAQIPNDWK